MSTSPLYPLIWKVRRVFQLLRGISDAVLEDLGINASQRAVLEVLSGEEQLSVPQMAKRLSVSRQHIQVLVNELLKKELVESAENPAHKRSSLIGISKAGLKLFSSIAKREHELLSALEPNFSESDLATSLSTLESFEKLLNSEDWKEK